VRHPARRTGWSVDRGRRPPGMVSHRARTGKLCCRCTHPTEATVATVGVDRGEAAKVHSDDAVGCLRLAVSLRVEGRGHEQLGAWKRHQPSRRPT
jgi:hypothetical protein